MTGAPPVVVIDTNVLISGLLSPFGKPGRIVDLLLSGHLRLAYDDRILLEYRDVLGRPDFGFIREQIERFFAIMPYQERVFPSAWSYPCSPDLSDVPFLEAAMASTRVLITGNMRHYPPACRGPVHVYAPADWWKVHLK